MAKSQEELEADLLDELSQRGVEIVDEGISVARNCYQIVYTSPDGNRDITALGSTRLDALHSVQVWLNAQ